MKMSGFMKLFSRSTAASTTSDDEGHAAQALKHEDGRRSFGHGMTPERPEPIYDREYSESFYWGMYPVY
jgi:hypothetical protein